MMPSALLDTLSTLGHYMSFGPLLSLFIYLLVYHGQYEQETDLWL